jgi:dTDP-3,4-didehydro-2,6-dideoxy-alpha-D-glucose 3-reductase
MKKIKIGILGCADIVKRLIAPNIISSQNFELYAFASRSEEKVNQFSSLFGGKKIIGYDNLLKLDEIQAVYIPLPISFHFEWIMKALKSGKHVFSEKSIALNFIEVSEIINEAKKRKLCVFENFMFPYHSQFNFVKNKIGNGIIGDIRMLKSSFGFPIFNYENNIRYKKKLGGGALLDAGAYTLMASQLFLGMNQKVISSFLNKHNEEVDFFGAITLVNEKSIVSQLSFGFDNHYSNDIELWGSKGKITIEKAFTSGENHLPKIKILNQGISKSYELATDNQFMNILNDFYDSIIHNRFFKQFEIILAQSKLIDDVIKFNQSNE